MPWLIFSVTDSDVYKEISKTSNAKIFGLAIKFLTLLGERPDVNPEKALQTFVKAAEAIGQRPVLIIDEANSVLLNSENDRVAVSSTLAQIFQLTKEEKRLDVIMASSEYGYPFVLEHAGMNLNNISRTLFAGEIPPKSMWELLVRKEEPNGEKVIGMGPNLASLLIGSYGGHFLRFSSSVTALERDGQNFMISSGLNPISRGIVRCLKQNPLRSKQLLTEMALHGFAQVEDLDEGTAELIVKENVGGLVSLEKGNMIGLPKSVWKKAGARHIIMEIVLYWYEEEERKRQTKKQEEEKEPGPIR